MSLPLATAAFLLFLGFYGIMTRRNLISMLMCMELMLNGANIALMTMARARPEHADEAGLLLIVLFAVAACEVAIGLSIVVSLFRETRSLDADQASAAA